MSPIWSSTTPLKTVSKGVWHAREMRTHGRWLQSKSAIPTSSWDATPRAQQGPTESVISYLAKQSRSRPALCNFPLQHPWVSQVLSPGKIHAGCWKTTCSLWCRGELHAKMVRLLWDRVCFKPVQSGQGSQGPHSFPFQLMSHYLAHTVPFAMQTGCLACSFVSGCVLGIQCYQTLIEWSNIS